MSSTSHRKYEKQIAGWLKERGQDVTYLEEHISFHLPTKEEAQGFIKGQKGEISYSGNLNVNRLLFKIHMTSLEGKIGKVVYFAKLIFNFFTNPVLYAMLSEKELSKNVVRAYLVIRK